MIYQCFHRPEQRAQLFQSPVYRAFGLEPSVSARLLRRCPELKTEAVRQFLNEYGAMLHIWRNWPYDWHRWIGFTSHRQLDKTPFVFETRKEIRRMLRRAPIVAWGCHDVSQLKCDGLTGAAAQLECSHPGGFAYLTLTLAQFGYAVPERFHTDAKVAYASYWVMRKSDFSDFMKFSWPLVDWMLRTRGDFDYVSNHPRSIGYIVERLFIVWYMRRGFTPLCLGPHPLS